MDFTIVIPARYASTRFPQKVLAKHRGHSLLSYTYQQACLAGAKQVVIATDHDAILDEAHVIGADVMMTSVHHFSATDRLAEVAEKLGIQDDEVVINWQADAPLLPFKVVQQLVEAFVVDRNLQVGTLSTPIRDVEAFLNPNAVKVVVDAQGMALYFSRSPMPWNCSEWQVPLAKNIPLDHRVHHRHIGVYAYRAGFLKRYTTWEPAPIEQLESLEQLRILWHGERIRVLEACESVPGGVDTPEDWEKIQPFLP